MWGAGLEGVRRERERELHARAPPRAVSRRSGRKAVGFSPPRPPIRTPCRVRPAPPNSRLITLVRLDHALSDPTSWFGLPGAVCRARAISLLGERKHRAGAPGSHNGLGPSFAKAGAPTRARPSPARRTPRIGVGLHFRPACGRWSGIWVGGRGRRRPRERGGGRGSARRLSPPLARCSQRSPLAPPPPPPTPVAPPPCPPSRPPPPRPPAWRPRPPRPARSPPAWPPRARAAGPWRRSRLGMRLLCP